MRRLNLRWRLLPPVLIAASVLVGVGCGVVNPDLLGAAGISNVASNNLTNGMVVMMLVNETGVSTDATLTVTKTINGVATDISMTLTAAANEHTVLVDDCQLETIQVTEARYAGTNGAVTIPSTVSPATMGQTLQCGGGIVVTLTGTPPGVFLNAFSF